MEFLSFPLFRRHRGEAQPSVRAVLDGERPIMVAQKFLKIHKNNYHFCYQLALDDLIIQGYFILYRTYAKPHFLRGVGGIGGVWNTIFPLVAA
jgi:hypothetical protein